MHCDFAGPVSGNFAGTVAYKTPMHADGFGHDRIESAERGKHTSAVFVDRDAKTFRPQQWCPLVDPHRPSALQEGHSRHEPAKTGTSDLGVASHLIRDLNDIKGDTRQSALPCHSIEECPGKANTQRSDCLNSLPQLRDNSA
jgi:hypothetical protein